MAVYVLAARAKYSKGRQKWSRLNIYVKPVLCYGDFACLRDAEVDVNLIKQPKNVYGV